MALGRSSKSFGIQVAELAGLPKHVVKQAWEILKALESNGTAGSSGSGTSQLSLFAAVPDDLPAHESVIPMPRTALALLDELKALDPDALRPIEALQKLAEWKHRVQSESE